jgi:hypothetical protein
VASNLERLFPEQLASEGVVVMEALMKAETTSS